MLAWWNKQIKDNEQRESQLQKSKEENGSAVRILFRGHRGVITCCGGVRQIRSRLLRGRIAWLCLWACSVIAAVLSGSKQVLHGKRQTAGGLLLFERRVMLGVDVTAQIHLPTKCAPAVLAGERLEACVLPRVGDEVGGLTEGLATVCAFVGFLAWNDTAVIDWWTI